MPVVERNGTAFHTQILGAGPPAVMLHGLLVGSMTTWYFGAAPRLARSHRTMLYDLRGHGRSARTTGGYDLATMVADLDALALGFAGDEPLTLIGHSYGAAAALRFALAHPARVARLVLVEAPMPPFLDSEFGDFLRRAPDEMAGALPDALRGVVERGGRAATRFLAQLRFLAVESTLLGDLAREAEHSDAELARIACPLLAVYGARSTCLPAGERLQRVVPGARLVVLPGGHFLPTEMPDALASVIVAFCEEGGLDG
jgi:pimeloyl-ACP methyl ester carboxylesterase